jgi:hypothetical protein
MTTKINIKPYLKVYVIAKFCNGEEVPINFPSKFDIYHTIWNLTEKRPLNCTIDNGNIEIHLPKRREGKNPRDYNYISEKSQKIIEKKIEHLFLCEFHEFVTQQKQTQNIAYIDSIWEFVKIYSLDNISVDTLWKDYYRYKNRLFTKKKRKYQKK